MKKIVLICISSIVLLTIFIYNKIYNETTNNENIISYSFTNEDKGIADGIITINWTNELNSYDKVTLYYAKNKEIITNYTPITTLEKGERKTSGEELLTTSIYNETNISSYKISNSKFIPEEADSICAEFSNEELENKYYFYDIPISKKIKKEEPLYRFYSVSDIHVSDETLYNNKNRQNFVNDLIINKDEIDFVVINGDIVDYGTTEQLESFEKFINKTFRENNIPMFFVNGNHEFNTLDDNNKIVQNGSEDRKTLLRLYKENLDLLTKTTEFKINREDEKLYYSVDFKNIKFIFLSTPIKTNYGVSYSINQTQLNWLDENLKKANESNQITFIFSHVNLKNYVPYKENSGINNTETLINILKKYKNVIVSTAHTHTDLSLDIKHTTINDLSEYFSYYNSGSIVWTFEYDEEGKEHYNMSYSTGYIVEIYKDKILLKAKKFMDDTKYISTSQYYIKL